MTTPESPEPNETAPQPVTHPPQELVTELQPPEPLSPKSVSPEPLSPEFMPTASAPAEPTPTGAEGPDARVPSGPESFAANVERLVAKGKLTAAEAAELLEPAHGSAAPEPQVTLSRQGDADATGVPDDLRLEVSGYGLQVVLDRSLTAPRLTANHEGLLSLQSGPAGWRVEHRRGQRGMNLRAVLSLPWLPRNVRAEVSGGNLNLPEVTGAVQIEVSGGNATLGAAAALKAEVSGGNLTAGEVGGDLHLEVNGGNLSVAGASSLQAEINGGQLSWTGRLTGGRHSLEVNGGQATLRLSEGSSVEVQAASTLGGVSASFPLSKSGGMMHATYQGVLGGGEARLTCEVNAGQIRLVGA